MFEVTLLHTNDKKQWLDILDGFRLKDPHYLPGYLQIYENESNNESFMHFGGEGMLFVYGDSKNFIIYPFFKRALSSLPFYERGMENLFDIASPYGYGGPLAQIEDETISEKLWRGFFSEIGAFCRQNNIVSEFSRLHPVFNNALAISKFSDGFTPHQHRIVYIDLTGSEDDIVARMDNKHRSSLRKANRNEALRCSITSEQEYAPLFSTLYEKTMMRKEAQTQYLFSSNFFNLAFQALRDHITMVYITYGSEPIAASLILRYGDLSYSWLSCSNQDYLNLRPNELCVYQCAIEARKRGCKFFILGGGLSGEDTLFRFKAAFSGLFKDFHTYKKIHLTNEYNALLELRNKYERAPAGDFFPGYRSYRIE